MWPWQFESLEAAEPSQIRVARSKYKYCQITKDRIFKYNNLSTKISKIFVWFYRNNKTLTGYYFVYFRLWQYVFKMAKCQPRVKEKKLLREENLLVSYALNNSVRAWLEIWEKLEVAHKWRHNPRNSFHQS